MYFHKLCSYARIRRNYKTVSTQIKTSIYSMRLGLICVRVPPKPPQPGPCRNQNYAPRISFARRRSVALNHKIPQCSRNVRARACACDTFVTPMLLLLLLLHVCRRIHLARHAVRQTKCGGGGFRAGAHPFGACGRVCRDKSVPAIHRMSHGGRRSPSEPNHVLAYMA